MKIKSDTIFSFVKLLLDPNIQIKQNVKIIFNQIHNKEQEMIYNLVPHLIQNFSAMDDVSENQFEEIIRYMTEFIEKERQINNLLESLIIALKDDELN